MIAVTFALPAESSDFLRHLRNQSRTDRSGIRTIRGTIEDRAVEVFHTGVGEKVCRQRVAEFLQDQQFDLLISTGFAGALSDELKVGDLLLAKNFSTIDLNERGSSFSSSPIRIADLLTVRALIDSNDERNKFLGSRVRPGLALKTDSIRAAALNLAFPYLSWASLPIRRANPFRPRRIA